MKFNVTYKVGNSLREKSIIADNLNHAEEIANEKIPNWEDVIMVDKSKGTTDY